MPPLITRQTPTHAEHTLTLSHTLPNTHSADRQINWITAAAIATTTKKKQRKQQNQISGDKTGFRVKSPLAVSPQQQEKKNLNTAKPNKTAKNRKKPKKMRQLLDLAFSIKANPAEANSCGSCKGCRTRHQTAQNTQGSTAPSLRSPSVHVSNLGYRKYFW